MLRAAIGALAVVALAATPAKAQIGLSGEGATEADLNQASADTGAAAGDPWEDVNRQSFKAFLLFDNVVLVPAAKVYRATTPAKGRKGIRAFLANTQSPVILANDILQGEFERAGETTARFVINSTIGFLGFADPAARLGIAPHAEDFGQTLAVWGVPSGPFLFLPIFGPSSVRDGIGLAGDIALDPLFWIDKDWAQYTRYGRFAGTAVARREPLIEPLEEIEDKSLDYYASLRSFYMQARKREISNGRSTYDDLIDIEDYDELEEIE